LKKDELLVSARGGEGFDHVGAGGASEKFPREGATGRFFGSDFGGKVVNTYATGENDSGCLPRSGGTQRDVFPRGKRGGRGAESRAARGRVDFPKASFKEKKTNISSLFERKKDIRWPREKGRERGKGTIDLFQLHVFYEERGRRCCTTLETARSYISGGSVFFLENHEVEKKTICGYRGKRENQPISLEGREWNLMQLVHRERDKEKRWS